MSSRIGWRFVDPKTQEDYTWLVNPNADNGGNALIRNATYRAANVANRRTVGGSDVSNTVMHESYVEQQNFSYSGNVYTETQYNDIVRWVKKSYPVEMYDDLYRGWLVYLTGFSPSRFKAKSVNSIYKHPYTLTGLILEEL